MILSSNEANIILQVLEAATDGNWPNTASAMLEKGYKPKEIISAWKNLETQAGMSGMAPEESDF